MPERCITVALTGRRWALTGTGVALGYLEKLDVE